MDRFDPEREEGRAIDQIFQRSRAVGAGVEGCFGQPGDQSGILDGERCPGGVDALCAGLLKHAPVQVRTQHTAGCSGNGLPLAVLLADPALDLSRSSGTLKPQKTAGLGGYTRPERVDGHDHPPTESRPGSQTRQVVSPQSIWASMTWQSCPWSGE